MPNTDLGLGCLNNEGSASENSCTGLQCLVYTPEVAGIDTSLALLWLQGHPLVKQTDLAYQADISAAGFPRW